MGLTCRRRPRRLPARDRARPAVVHASRRARRSRSCPCDTRARPATGPSPRTTRSTRGTGAARSRGRGRAARRQDGRAQGQRLRRRRADDERVLAPGRVRAGRRRHDRHADPRRRRHDHRQGDVRAPRRLRREPHVRHRPGPEPARPVAHRRRLVERLRRAGRHGRGRHGDRRRPGRARSACPPRSAGMYGLKPTYGLVPYSGVFEDRVHARPRRPDGGHSARHRAAAGGDRGAGRDRSTAARRRRSATTWLRSTRASRACGSGSSPRGSSGRAPSRRSPTPCARPREGLRELGAVVEDVSIPLHRDSPHIWRAIAAEGAHVRVLRGNGRASGPRATTTPP